MESGQSVPSFRASFWFLDKREAGNKVTGKKVTEKKTEISTSINIIRIIIMLRSTSQYIITSINQNSDFL